MYTTTALWKINTIFLSRCTYPVLNMGTGSLVSIVSLAPARTLLLATVHSSTHCFPYVSMHTIIVNTPLKSNCADPPHMYRI
jgi:hypothetical protein